jgi:apolipoprotein D and lipocalin family protein
MVAGLSLFVVGCATTPPPPTVDYVDLDRFMGDWYVIGGIFTPLEKGAHNALETYERGEDGRIDTTFTFRKGGFDGPEKVYRPTGFIHDQETNAEWRMQFLWPFKAAYLILYLDDAYSHTAIGVPSRRYLWIMARSPEVDEDVYQGIVDQMVAVGYQTNRLVRVPHQWP